MIKRQMFAGGDKLLFERAAALRKQPTFSEDLLWNYLRTKPLGYKFRRQHVYLLYILDFYCHALQLCIEVDGSIHNVEEIKKADDERQLNLEKRGLSVLRFTNEEVRLQPENVYKKIETFILQHQKDVAKKD